jgi:Integrase core domain
VENPTHPFQHISMDFVTHLPVSTHGYDAIFSIVDRFSCLCRFIPCHSYMSALDCAQLFWEHWVCKFGMPGKIVSDRDAKFTSGFW